jgi:hypothetical protein
MREKEESRFHPLFFFPSLSRPKNPKKKYRASCVGLNTRRPRRSFIASDGRMVRREREEKREGRKGDPERCRDVDAGWKS